MLQSQLWSLDCNLGLGYMDDADLVAGLRRGDAQAVEYVVRQYAPALYRFAYYQLQDAMLAEDLVSEVMVRMINHIDGFVLGRATFQAWLFRIARNLITDHYRARQRHPQVSLEAILNAEPGYEPGEYDPQIEALLDREQLAAGLAILTDEQRQVILLHVVEGWELPQIADLLDRSLASIKGLYYRGIQSLHRALAANNSSQDRND
jgi:RNA polymerase sigma-70 factor (ECF subfamily)